MLSFFFEKSSINEIDFSFVFICLHVSCCFHYDAKTNKKFFFLKSNIASPTQNTVIQDLSRILHYKNMGQEALWIDCAEKLTSMIQNIIEFAKLIPGFMRLSQDDQVC